MVPHTSSISGASSFVNLSFEVVHGKFVSVLDLQLHGEVLKGKALGDLPIQ